MTVVAWFHPFSGIAGDMALGALLDAGADPQAVQSAIEALGIRGWKLDVRTVTRAGLTATLADVHTDDTADHRRFTTIAAMIQAADVPLRVRKRSLQVFTRLAEVEGQLHGVAPTEVEFHEVGSLDALIDVVGTCAALESLMVDEVACGPVALGHGTVSAQHGVLPNPAPAVAQLLIGAPIVGVDRPVELTTPTGAALLAGLVSGWGPMPAMELTATGLGAGQRNPQDHPNVTQVMIGRRQAGSGVEPLVMLEGNVDDASGEVLADTVQQLLRAGALDAWLTPIVMKKGRPASTVHALAMPADAERLGRVLVEHSGSLGLRRWPVARWSAARQVDSVEVGGQVISIKVTGHRAKAEYDDAARAAEALGRPVREVIALAESSWRAAQVAHDPAPAEQ